MSKTWKLGQGGGGGLGCSPPFSAHTLPGTSTYSPLAGSTETGCEGWGVWEGGFHLHFSQSLPMAAKTKTVKSTIRITTLAKRRKTSSSLGWEQQQGLQGAISSTLILTHFPKPHLPEAPPRSRTRSFSGPHPGHPPPAPSTRVPAPFSSEAENLRAPTLPAERRETWRLRGKTLGRDGALTPQLLMLPRPGEPRPWKLSHQHQPACDKKSSPDDV